jgi:hypothetical protein
MVKEKLRMTIKKRYLAGSSTGYDKLSKNAR